MHESLSGTHADLQVDPHGLPGRRDWADPAGGQAARTGNSSVTAQRDGRMALEQPGKIYDWTTGRGLVGDSQVVG